MCLCRFAPIPGLPVLPFTNGGFSAVCHCGSLLGDKRSQAVVIGKFDYNFIQPHGDCAIESAGRLITILAEMKSVAVALSGGVDSAVVAKAAYLALGDRAVAFTADSPSVARRDLEAAHLVASTIGMRHEVLKTSEFEKAAYRANDGTRCYHCKSELYLQVAARLVEFGLAVVCSGANQDDLGDYRPGLAAAAERGVRHPLIEAGIGKAEVRALAKAWDLPVWQKPASPCLSSRLAPGVEATAERVARVEDAETFLRELGYADCRVRVHAGELARIEIPTGDIDGFFLKGHGVEARRKLTELGFRFVTIDLGGLNSGGMNELVPLEIRARFSRP